MTSQRRHSKPHLSRSHHRYVLGLTVAYILIWILLGLQPFHRAHWALENTLSIVIVLVLALAYRRFPFSRVSYTLGFVFLLFHTLGSHFTYAEVPYDRWFQSLFGISVNEIFGWERNNFDRFVHFLYGLLIAYPIREIYVRIVGVRGFWGYSLPVIFAMASSLFFELLEWAVVLVFGSEVDVAYLGTQGDRWDAQKDMLLASLGALIAMSITAFVNYKYQRDFAEEWAESLQVKRPEPLGEVRFRRLRDLMRKKQ